VKSYQATELQIRENEAVEFEKRYSQSKGPVFDLLERHMFSEAVKAVRPSRLLDIGCGTGRITEAVAPLVREVQAIDLSENSIALLARKHLPNVTGQQANVTEPLPFPSGSFDAIVSCQVLQHLNLEDLVTALSECRRVLKPSGTLIFSVYNLDFFKHRGLFEDLEPNGLYLKRWNVAFAKLAADRARFEETRRKYYRSLGHLFSAYRRPASQSGTVIGFDQFIASLPWIGPRASFYTLLEWKPKQS
jgi:ubiquinone/menaquinone biosynthesis C-methylase UbiE